MDEQELEDLIDALNMAIRVLPKEHQAIAWKLAQAKASVFEALKGLARKE